MNLYSILLVDDEQEIIDAMATRVDWNELGFKIAGSANNGVEALEMASEETPDVVLTDIKMPYMDGLQLARELKNLYPSIKLLIGSGFDEFDFAREAMAIGVQEYLLKPIDSEEIKRVFTKLHKQLDEEREIRSSVEHLESYYQKSLPTLRENYLSMLVEGDVPEDYTERFLKDYGIEFGSPEGPFVVGVIHTSHTINPEASTRLLSLSVRKMADEWQNDGTGTYVFSYRENIVIITELGEGGFDEFYTRCERFCRTAEHMLKATVTIGVGPIVHSIEELSRSYKGAREAVSYRVIYGAGMPINIAEIDPKETFTDVGEADLMQNIFKQIKLGTQEDLENAIDRYITTLVEARPSINRFRLILMDLMTGFYRFCENNSIESFKVDFDNADMYQVLARMESAKELESWLRDMSLKIREEVINQRSNKNRSIVDKAKDFVRDNYSNPELTIDMVCSELCVSAPYFSTVFKKETGKTFIVYLTEYRMNEAIRLLIEQDEKTYIIAEKVGYSDANYFSYVFKKQFGVSPTLYKRQEKNK